MFRRFMRAGIWVAFGCVLLWIAVNVAGMIRWALSN